MIFMAAGRHALACLLLLTRVSLGFVSVQEASLRILSPLPLSLIHSTSIDVAFQIHSANLDVHMEAVMLINGTEVLRTPVMEGASQPSVSLEGLHSGVCDLSILLVSGGRIQSRDDAVFLIFSHASSSTEGAKAQPIKSADYAWHAVSLGSDDWGRTCDIIPVFASLSELLDAQEQGWDPGAWGRATTETADDLYRLFDAIEGLNKMAPSHQHLVLTPYWIVGGPDFEAMHRLGCPTSDRCVYVERRIDTGSGPTGGWPHSRGDLRRVYRSGYESKLWHPQYHGRSHFDQRAWMSYLASDNVAQEWFERGVVFCNDTSLDTNGRPRTLLSEHGREHEIKDVSENNSTEIAAWAREGVAAFSRFWGYSSIVASMPHHACLPSIGETLYEMGFIALDNNDFGPPLSATSRVGFEPCCLPRSLVDARTLIKSLLDEGGEGHVNIQMHAQNFHSSAISDHEYMVRVKEVAELITWIRHEYPSTVFVTSSELVQLKMQGWSREVWHDCLRYRNHLSSPVMVTIDRHAAFYKYKASTAGLHHQHTESEAWEWNTVEIHRMPYGLKAGGEIAGVASCTTAEVGDQMGLLSGFLYTVISAPGIKLGDLCRDKSVGAENEGTGNEGNSRMAIKVKDVSPRVVHEHDHARGAVGSRVSSVASRVKVDLEGVLQQDKLLCEWRGGGLPGGIEGEANEIAADSFECGVPRAIKGHTIMYLRVSDMGKRSRGSSRWIALLVLPRGMAQAQPRDLNRPWMAEQSWATEVLAEGDGQIKLEGGLRVCLMCGCAGHLPGWINLDTPSSHSACPLPPDDGTSGTLFGTVTEWEVRDGLEFLPEKGLRDIVVGQDFRIDWDKEDQVALAEELFDNIWRALEPGGLVRLVRHTRLSQASDISRLESFPKIPHAKQASKEFLHHSWEGARFRCAWNDVEFGCKGQPDDTSSILLLAERAGLEQYGEGINGQEGQNAVHTLWPAVGGTSNLRIFHVRRPVAAWDVEMKA